MQAPNYKWPEIDPESTAKTCLKINDQHSVHCSKKEPLLFLELNLL